MKFGTHIFIYAIEVCSHFRGFHSDFCVFKNWNSCEKCKHFFITKKHLKITNIFMVESWRNKGQTYAKIWAILSSLLFTPDLFLYEVQNSTYSQFSKKRQKNAPKQNIKEKIFCRFLENCSKTRTKNKA